MQWLNEPPQWSEGDAEVTVSTGADTDFWLKTHYGFTHDNGHFYFRQLTGDFTVQVAYKAEYRNLYDQAGLMLRQDAENWIKAGTEFLDGREHLSAVVTRGFSDWSVHSSHHHAEVWLRMRREGDAVKIEYSFDSVEFNLMRLAYFPTGDAIDVGLMCCSPKGEGLEVRFVDFAVERATPMNESAEP